MDHEDQLTDRCFREGPGRVRGHRTISVLSISWRGKIKVCETYLLCRVPDLATRLLLTGVAKCQVTQLVTLMEYLVANGKVDDAGEQNAHPDRHVVGEYSQGAPVVIDPAPQLRTSHR